MSTRPGRAPGSAWWSRSRGLPPAAYASWCAALLARPDSPPARILAWARGTDLLCVGSPALLSFSTDEGQAWSHVGWHDIERGGWDGADGTLRWRVYGGQERALQLSEPGRLPELFRERVSASIAVERFVPLSGGRGVVVTARRPLGSTAPLTWHTGLSRGLSPTSPGVRAAVDQVLAEVRSEYDFGSEPARVSSRDPL